ncbi:MAG: sensor histidine kinase [Candidatus Nanopelagicales bacterium]
MATSRVWVIAPRLSSSNGAGAEPIAVLRRWTIWASPWLVFLIGAFQHAASADSVTKRVVGAAGLILFCLLYAIGPPRVLNRSVRDPLRWGLPVAMLALACAILPMTGDQGLTTFVFVGVVLMICWVPRAALLGIISLLVLAPSLELLVPGWDGNPFDIVLSTALACLAAWGVLSVIRRDRELAEAREELARLAVSEERLRFARDLHDIVGHSLTALSVKAELAGRLVGRDDKKAAREIADVEGLARQALKDVRAAVHGYRDVTLAGELASARSVLESAGIAADLPGTVDHVDGANRELFGWVVREAVTNVVRHSGAQRVRISVTPSTIDIVDDGRGRTPLTPDRAEPTPGSGLAGLRERVEAVGGSLLVGPEDVRGWRVRAQVPA